MAEQGMAYEQEGVGEKANVHTAEWAHIPWWEHPGFWLRPRQKQTANQDKQ